MGIEFWLDVWKENVLGFHQARPNVKLVQYFPEIKGGKVMVPLCGKSLDMIWLAEQGHEVLGIEISPLACDSFFKENNLDYSVASLGDGTLYRGKMISIWCGDFFKMPAQLWEGCTSIFDRAALIALPSKIRQPYSEALLSGMKANPQFKAMLLITIEYEGGAKEGPPYSVPKSEVIEKYGSHCTIRVLESKTKEIEVIENVFWITPK